MSSRRLNSLVIALLGLLVTAPGAVAGPITRSTVAFAYADPIYPFSGSYASYGVDMAAWVYLPVAVDQSTDTSSYRSILDIHDKGQKLTSTRIEWDVVFWGMTQRYPNLYTEAAVRNFDGEPMTLPWNSQELWFCSHQPLFDEYVRWQISDQALASGARPDFFLLDSQTSTPMTYHYGGCFCDACSEDFRGWLEAEYTGPELSALGISDIGTWNYHQHLVDHGYDRTSYETAAQVWPNAVPLSESYRRFQLDWLNQYIEGLIETIQSEGGPGYDPGIGTSSPIWEEYWPGTRTLFDVPGVSHLVLELNHEAAAGAVPTDPVLVYRMSDVFEQNVVVTGEPSTDWAYMLAHDKASLMRSWIALAYANGANFIVPVYQWAGGSDFYSATPAEIVDLYEFIEGHPFLYDSMEAVSQTAVVYVNTAVRNNSQNIHLAVDELQAQNIPFHLAVAGDDWWGRSLDEGRLDGATAIVLTGDEGALDAAQSDFLGSHGDRVALWSDTAGIEALQPRQITLGNGVGNGDVRVFPRGNPDDPTSPWVLHLVNTSLVVDGENDSVTPRENFSLTIRRDLFGGAPLTAIYHDLDGSDTTLAITHTEEVYSVTVPRLDSYGVVELTTTGVPATAPETSSDRVHPFEGFDHSLTPGSTLTLDSTVPENEQIHRFSSGWAWGGYAGTTGSASITQNTNWGGVCQFQNGARAGSRIYTRFDQSTEPAGNGADQPASTYDLTLPEASFSLGISMTSEQQDWAFLVRDDQSWWQSSPITIPILDWDTQRVLYTDVAALSWTQIEISSGGGLDMDEVDAGGESSHSDGVRTDPNLCAVEGVGLIAVGEGTSQWTLNFIGVAFAGDGPSDSCVVDHDADGLPDSVETNTGVYNGWFDTGTDPMVADTDGDGIDDFTERAIGSDPNDASSTSASSVPGIPSPAAWMALALVLAGGGGFALSRRTN